MNDTDRKAAIRNGCELLGDKYSSPDAELLLAAIAFQESNFKYRKQINGPARGLWQFERNGGVRGVMKHPSTAVMALRVCIKLKIEPTYTAVYEALATNDILAAAFARLLLYTDPRPLPTNQNDAWEYYIRNWRPGKPHPQRWAASWEAAKNLLA